MTFRNVASLALILALVSLGAYWFISRPTVEERALMDFFKEFRGGRYDDAQEYTAGDDFYEMAASSSVRDNDGTEYLIGDYFPPSRKGILRASIETYVRMHIARWKYLSMETQRVEEGYSAVHFRMDIGIREFTPASALTGIVHEGRVEGTAHMILEDGRWVVRNFEFSIFSDEGLNLSTYLERAI